MVDQDKSVKEFFVISRVYGAYYEIYSETRGIVRAFLRGKLRTISAEERHPFVVGDRILAEPSSGKDWVISERMERKSFLTRKSRTGDTQVLCANADQTAVLVSLKSPETKDGFIDRCLAAVFTSNTKPLILFTKSDLVNSEEIESRLKTYRDLGYRVLAVSCADGNGLAELWSFLKGKTTFLVGNSGVGKSTLLNSLIRKEVQKTSGISSSTDKGKHTTTNSLLLVLDEDTVLIDSPGIKEWGILHLKKEEIMESFPELFSQKKHCEESNCCNLSSDCAMLSAMQGDEIMTLERKKSLESMITSLDNPHRVTRRDRISK
ncbi:ribosome small subunit-dependent GTPase A [Leptospira gomenensis]|uniref:Small ribosomal subunit biogenesis GTPase RsgA n=1 Tax=Leptospira gomenensis TaxID=2484974 RepID=A0A5F1YPU6_9LEPT|nr:ribosome small subunit-dependent GTPase A [Leptospira gomenensis]TGK28110.1 ribosome small subunit-dependent GTPase A [Leptospira gomenensis]TGK37034.1 ribosome small subunit-dependent GTPase A [Leptospira gomenensis]TGK45670.1 ribosome small subunit-dependent GTPase A [Leptospira gomenensis]TGK59609.1 ribosome small subunit-dependent GTPase A [Leptospira gomenensis]